MRLARYMHRIAGSAFFFEIVGLNDRTFLHKKTIGNHNCTRPSGNTENVLVFAASFLNYNRITTMKISLGFSMILNYNGVFSSTIENAMIFSNYQIALDL